jgi:hypothetical protein
MVWYRSLPTEGVRRSLAAIFTRPARGSALFFRITQPQGASSFCLAVSSLGKVSGGKVARCLNLYLRNQHAVNRTSLGDLHQSAKLILRKFSAESDPY